MAAGAAQLIPATVAFPARTRREVGPEIVRGRNRLRTSWLSLFTHFCRRENCLSMDATGDVRMRFDDVSIAVKSIDRAYEFFAKYFPHKLAQPKTDRLAGRRFVCWQDFHLGGFVVELIEDPPGKPGFVTKFIDKHGEGLHHLSIETDNLDAMVA